MKSKFTIILMLLAPFFTLRAQQPIILSEDTLQIGNSLLPAIAVNIPEAQYDDVLKQWVRELESGTKSKVQTSNGEMQIMGAKIKDISKDAINVYSRLDRLDSALMLYASFETSKDVYITSKAGVSEFTMTCEFLKEFAKDQYIDVAKQQADTEEKKLRDLEKELSSLENEKGKMERSIESDKSTIASEKENILLMNNEINTVNSALASQDTLLAGFDDKEKDKQIKDLEKRKKKAENSIESSDRTIQKCEENIYKNTAEIPQNERMQEMVRTQIAQQQEIYQRFEDKLSKIKSY